MFKKNIFESFVKKEISKEDAVEKHDSLKYLESESEEKIFDFQEEKEKLISKMHELMKTADDGVKYF